MMMGYDDDMGGDDRRDSDMYMRSATRRSVRGRKAAQGKKIVDEGLAPSVSAGSRISKTGVQGQKDLVGAMPRMTLVKEAMQQIKKAKAKGELVSHLTVADQLRALRNTQPDLKRVAHVKATRDIKDSARHSTAKATTRTQKVKKMATRSSTPLVLRLAFWRPYIRSFLSPLFFFLVWVLGCVRQKRASEDAADGVRGLGQCTDPWTSRWR
eukprot:903420-Rhodomonas_salina.2